MLREIDTRILPGIGRVELTYDDETPDFFMVFVKDEAGVNLTTMGAKTFAAALEMFVHPFADPATPDLFQRTEVSA